MGRTKISKKTRFEVFKRDGFQCQYCGDVPPKVVLEIDHIQAVSVCGSDDQDNLITACFDCNRGKGARDVSVAPKSLAQKSKEIQEKEDQLKGYYLIMAAQKERQEREVWQVLKELGEDTELGVNKQWFTSVKMFIQKIGYFEVLDAAEIANAKYFGYKRFRYFCGVCWNKYREKQDG